MQTETILTGILALLVAARDKRTDRPTSRVLADAGLTAEQIAAVTGHDPASLAAPPTTAFGQH